MVPIGALEIVTRRYLHLADRRGIAGQLRARRLCHEVVGAFGPPYLRPCAEGIVAPREVADREGVLETAIDRRAHDLDLRGAASQILRHTAHEVVRPWLNGVTNARAVQALHERALAPRHGVQCADRPTARRPAGQLGRAEDGRVLWLVHVLIERIAVRGQLWLSPDPSGAEHRQAGDIRAEETVEPAQPEVACAFDEKRSTLTQERLEISEIHDGRIDFHLTEIGIHGGIERQVRRQ